MIIFLGHSSQVMSLVCSLQSIWRMSKNPKAKAFKFLLAQMKSGFQQPQIEIQPSIGVIVEWQSYNNQNETKSSTEGQEPRNVEVRKFKQEAKWQRISWNYGKESNKVKKPTGIEAPGKKENKRNLKQRYSFKWSATWMHAERNEAIAMIKTASRQAAQTISNQRSASFALARVWWRR